MATSSKQRIVKLLNLSASDNDHEALLALRNAQRLMKQGGLTWEALFAGTASSSSRTASTQTRSARPRKAAKPPATPKRDIEVPPEPKYKPARAKYRWLRQLFEFILAQELTTRQKEFFRGLHSSWVEYGSLTPKQQDALERTCSAKGFSPSSD
jgi:hypothetical protein